MPKTELRETVENQNLSLTPNCRKEKSLSGKNVKNLILNVLEDIFFIKKCLIAKLCTYLTKD